MPTDAFSSLQFLFPEQLWQIDWDEAAEVNQGEAGKLVEIARQQMNLLHRMREVAPTPESVAWTVLWTRNFNMVMAAVALLQSDCGITKAGQVFAMRLLWRSNFELHLQLRFVRGGERGTLFGAPSSEQLSDICDRLRAYLAWCLWNDIKYFDRLLEKRTRGMMWNNHLEIEAEKDPNVKGLIEYLWGSAEDLKSPEEVRHDRHSAPEWFFTQRSRYLTWLEDYRLRPFYERLRGVEGPMSFFELADPTVTTLRDVMSELGQGLAYPAYQWASNLAHGSTVHQHFEFIEDELFPGIAALDDEVDRPASRLRQFTNFNLRCLEELTMALQ